MTGSMDAACHARRSRGIRPRSFPYAILPVGSFEQHGPHLPLDTDNLIAERMALETAKRSIGLVLPCSPSATPGSGGQSGTLTFRFDTYMSVIRDIAESLDAWGIKALFVISGPRIEPAAGEARDPRTDPRQAVDQGSQLDLSGARRDARRSRLEALGGDFHAEEIETSLMLAIAPERVHMDRAAPDYPAVPSDYGRSEVSMGHIMGSGVFGDPTPATAEKGHRWIDIGARRSAELWLGYLDRHGFRTSERR